MILAFSGLCFLLLFRLRFGQAGDEDGLWCPAVHATALVGTFRIVAGEVVIDLPLSFHPAAFRVFACCMPGWAG